MNLLLDGSTRIVQGGPVLYDQGEDMTGMSDDWASAGIKAITRLRIHVGRRGFSVGGEPLPDSFSEEHTAVPAPAPNDTNPKTVYGQAKPGPSVVPPGAILECSMAMAEGNQKYGRTNWRDDPVSFSTYFDALLRHAYQAYDGEDRCPKSGALHMAHAMANCAIILDAMACGTLIDDRPTKGASSKLIDQYTKEIAPHG